MNPNFFNRPYPILKFKSKRHKAIWWEMDEIYSLIYLWPHNKKAFDKMLEEVTAYMDKNKKEI